MAQTTKATVEKPEVVVKPEQKVKILDIGKLGMRKRKVLEMRRVKNIGPQAGKMVMEEVWVERELPQPILNNEEAALLVDADWGKSRNKLRMNGRFMCVFSGRRFFADNIPGMTDDLVVPIVVVEDADLFTKEQLIIGIQEVAAKAFFNTTQMTFDAAKLRDFITSYDLGSPKLDKNNKTQLINIFNGLLDKIRIAEAE